MKKIILIISLGLYLFSCGDDIKNGNYKTYYENGLLKTDENWKDGKLNGKFKRYYENGQLEFGLFNCFNYLIIFVN